MKKHYILILISFLTCSVYGQNYDYSLMFRGVNPGTGNYEFALIATPDFEQITNAPTADMGAAIYIPSGYTLGNFANGNSGLQFFEWANSQENSYDGDVTDLVQLLRTDIVANNFAHTSGDLMELVIFEIISDLGDGNNPTTGTITLAENTDPNVTTNFYESYININLQDGNGTQDYFGEHDPMGNSINFETLSIEEESSLINNIDIYPNPTSDYINITTNLMVEHVEVYNLLGKIVLTTTVSQNINMNPFDSGVYLLKIKTNKGDVIKRIIKK